MTLNKCERDLVEEVRRRRITHYEQAMDGQGSRRYLNLYRHRSAEELAAMKQQTVAASALEAYRQGRRFSLSLTGVMIFEVPQ
jgi:hypothetical protein